MFDSIGSLIGRLPRHSKISGVVLALTVRNAFGKVLFDVCADLPSDKLKTVKAKSFADGILTVDCPGLMHSELSMRSGELLKVLNKELGGRAVKRIKFRNY